MNEQLDFDSMGEEPQSATGNQQVPSERPTPPKEVNQPDASVERLDDNYTSESPVVDRDLPPVIAAVLGTAGPNGVRKLAFKPAEVVEITGLGRSTVWARMKDGSLRYQQVTPNKRVIPIWHLLDFLGYEDPDSHVA